MISDNILNVRDPGEISFQMNLERRRIIDLQGRLILVRSAHPVLSRRLEIQCRGLYQRMQTGWRGLDDRAARTRLAQFVVEIEALETEWLDAWDGSACRWETPG